jgi:hypothetical protein
MKQLLLYTVPAYHRLFNYTDDNALINQLLAPLKIGIEAYIKTKAHNCVFYKPVSVANSWQYFPASPAEKFGG